MKPSTMLTAGSRYVNLSRDWIQPLHCAQNFASYHESANPSRQGLQVVYYADCRYSAKSKLCRLYKSNAPFGAAMERMSIVDPKSKLKKKIQDPTPKSKNPHIRLELFFPMRLQISEWDLGPAVIPQSIELF